MPQRLPKNMQAIPRIKPAKEDKVIVVDLLGDVASAQLTPGVWVRRANHSGRTMNLILSCPVEHVLAGAEQYVAMLDGVGFRPDKLRRFDWIDAELMHAFVDPFRAEVSHDRQDRLTEAQANLLGLD